MRPRSSAIACSASPCSAASRPSSASRSTDAALAAAASCARSSSASTRCAFAVRSIASRCSAAARSIASWRSASDRFIASSRSATARSIASWRSACARSIASWRSAASCSACARYSAIARSATARCSSSAPSTSPRRTSRSSRAARSRATRGLGRGAHGGDLLAQPLALGLAALPGAVGLVAGALDLLARLLERLAGELGVLARVDQRLLQRERVRRVDGPAPGRGGRGRIRALGHCRLLRVFGDRRVLVRRLLRAPREKRARRDRGGGRATMNSRPTSSCASSTASGWPFQANVARQGASSSGVASIGRAGQAMRLALGVDDEDQRSEPAAVQAAPATYDLQLLG